MGAKVAISANGVKGNQGFKVTKQSQWAKSCHQRKQNKTFSR
jgi:hypothetical protein